MDLNINYIHSAPENLSIKNKFDIILNMEVVEHVSRLDLFIENCSSLLEKRGIMFVATINRNLKSYIFAILGAEYVLRWLPIGTHEWDKFVTPQELEIIAKQNNFRLNELVGMNYNLIKKEWIKSNDSSVNYIATFLKD
jgi:2-polyprenyl-6-hydroxyphenyl methylase / 3-demethylubiquinone-9 3-methyltransferase